MRRTWFVWLALLLAAAPPAAAEELGNDQLASFTGSPGGFFVCFDRTPRGPGDIIPNFQAHPDCLVGYVVPPGNAEAGRLRVIGNGRSLGGFPIIEEIHLDPADLIEGAGRISITLTFRDLGRVDVVMSSAGPAVSGWGNEHCALSGLNYRVSAPGLSVFVASSARGIISRRDENEHASQYTLAERAPACGSYFRGTASGYWRLKRHPRPGDEVPTPPPLR